MTNLFTFLPFSINADIQVKAVVEEAEGQRQNFCIVYYIITYKDISLVKKYSLKNKYSVPALNPDPDLRLMIFRIRSLEIPF